jgi:hypothetical protein
VILDLRDRIDEIRLAADGNSARWLAISLADHLCSQLGVSLTPALVERREVGVNRYRTPLRTFNGRNALVDALQEALDLCIYLHQHELEGGEK